MHDHVQAQIALEKNAKPSGILSDPLGREYARSHGNPSDIVVGKGPRRVQNAESSRLVVDTGTELVAGAEVRKRVEAQIRSLAQTLIDDAQTKKLRASLAERDAIEAKIQALRKRMKSFLAALSPMHEPLVEAKAACRAMNAQLIVLVLPIDVQVSPTEWDTYKSARVDMKPTQVLIDDVMKAADDLDIPAYSAMDALRAAEPGAFLDADIHMTPKGHRAVADGLSKFLFGI